MEYIEANPLPKVCQECESKGIGQDCGSCDYGGLRFYLSDIDSLQVSRRGLLRRIERDTRKVREIEKRLRELGVEVK